MVGSAITGASSSSPPQLAATIAPTATRPTQPRPRIRRLPQYRVITLPTQDILELLDAAEALERKRAHARRRSKEYRQRTKKSDA